jgi:PAS domain S-box-containing protein
MPMDGVRAEGRGAQLRWFRVQRMDAWLTILGILSCLLTGPGAASQPNAKNVLILFTSFDKDYDSLRVLESNTRAHSPGRINFHTEYLENPRFEERSYRESLAETIGQGCSAIEPDVVITEGFAALQFATEYRNKMFPGVPIVFVGTSPGEFEQQKIRAGVTGVTTPVGMRATIELALHLHPDTNAVAVITGVSEWETYWLAQAQAELLRHQDKVKELDLVGTSNRQLLESVAALPPHTVALFQLAPRDLIRSQPDVGTWDLLAATAQRVPTYSPWPALSLENGGIGGAYLDGLKAIALTGEIAGRVLSGEQPESIPVMGSNSFQVRVDWRALQRWHIPESALPPGSVILNRPPSFWVSYRKYFIAAIVAIAALLVLMIGLLWQLTRKRKAESLLRETEERFRVMADATPALIWMCDTEGQITYLNERWLSFTGRDPQTGYGEAWTAFVHPDEVKNVLDTLSQALRDHRPFSNECRLRRSDGLYRWMLDVAAPRVNGDGSFAGFIGSAIDTTDQKLAQQALDKVSGQMIEAQEKERSRIARDLHDDICQRLALLSMEIEQTNRVSGSLPAPAKGRLQEIRKHCSEITSDVQSLSHQLHSSKLDSLGLESAIRGFCREFSKQHEVDVEFRARNVPKHLPKEISLCLFRVAQEALQNAVKYSGVGEFTVELLTLEGEVHLVVADEGAGFDVEEAKRNQGLGLMSMQERLHLVHGVLSVESKPGRGTHILAVVPLDGRSLHDEEVNEIARVTGLP